MAKDSDKISSKELIYLNEKLKKKGSKSKAYLINEFTGEISIPSRIENFNAQIKRYLNSACPLWKVLLAFRAIEANQLNDFQVEFESKRILSQEKNGIALIEEIKEQYPEYIYNRVKTKL